MVTVSLQENEDSGGEWQQYFYNNVHVTNGIEMYT